MSNSFDSYFNERKKELSESNTGIQQRKSMSQDERSALAVDKMAGRFKEFAEKSGKELTHEQAIKEARNVAERVDRQRIEDK